MRPLLSRLLCLLAVIGAIAAPLLFTVKSDIQRAESALAAARPLEAAAEYRHAALFLFWRADLWERAGHAAFLGADVPAAVQMFTQARILSAQGWLELGQAYYQLGNYKKSIEALQRGLQAHGPDLRLYRELILAYNAQDDFPSEAHALKMALAFDENDAALHHRLGLLLAILEPDQSLPELMTAAKLDPAYDPEVQTMRSALNLSTLAAEEADRLVAVGRGLGLVNEWRLAHAAFQRAVAVDGKNAEAWAWLGEANQHLGRDGRAELQRAAALEPFSANVRALYGLYWKRQNDPQQALAQFQWAAVIEPENPAFVAALADAYVFAGELPLAMAAYQRATELAPADVTYWRLLALFCAQYSFQVQDVGLPAARQVLRLAPKQAASFDLLGWTYLAADELTLAEANLRAALRLDPNSAVAHLHLGMTYLQMNHMDAARTHLLQARTLDPQGAEGQAAAQLLALYFP